MDLSLPFLHTGGVIRDPESFVLLFPLTHITINICHETYGRLAGAADQGTQSRTLPQNRLQNTNASQKIIFQQNCGTTI